MSTTVSARRDEAGSVPAGLRLRLDTLARRYRTGRVMVGGTPLRIVRLSAAGARRVDAWMAGAPVGPDPGDGALARRLLDAGLVHPRPGDEPRPDGQGYTPRDVTMVVPVKDDPTGVARVVAATRDLADRIVVDDGSTAPLLSATVRHTSPRGPAAARNTGWRDARTELIAFLDADTEPAPGWLDAILPLFDDPRVAAVAPRVRSRPGTTALDRYEQRRSSLDMGAEPATVRQLSRVSYVPTAALVVRRSALAETGGFDEHLRYGEDVDLIWRLTSAGHTIRYEPAATVWHSPRPNLREWARQRYHYGTSAAPLADRHPDALACARLSPSTALTWTLAATGHPRAALTTASVSAIRLVRALHRADLPVGAAVRLAARSHMSTGQMLASAVRRGWWPLTLLTRRGRRILLASLTPCLFGARRPSDAVLHVADDIAYSAGVWAGSIRHRTAAPLLPQRPGRDR